MPHWPFDRSDAVTYSNIISGTGSLTQLGAGTLILTGANTYTGGTIISEGTLQIGNGGVIGSVTGDILDNAALAFDRSDIITYGGVISGTGSLSQNGTGTLILTADNTYTGGTTISAGILQIGDGGTTGSVTGDILDDTSLVFDRSDTVTYDGVISGGGSLAQNGAGTLILTGANAYTGGTTISAGILEIGDGSIRGSITGNILDNAALIFNRSDAITYGGLISGTGGSRPNWAPVRSSSRPTTPTPAARTTISDGTLQIGNGGIIGSVTGDILDNAAALAFDQQCDAVTYSNIIIRHRQFDPTGCGHADAHRCQHLHRRHHNLRGATLQIGNGGVPSAASPATSWTMPHWPSITARQYHLTPASDLPAPAASSQNSGHGHA